MNKLKGFGKYQDTASLVFWGIENLSFHLHDRKNPGMECQGRRFFNFCIYFYKRWFYKRT